MQMKSMTLFLAASAVTVAGSMAMQSGARAEEYRGTMEQQMACTPDVWRFCGDQIPDVDRIVACLRRNTPQLSGDCRAVFESNNSMDQPPPARGRRAAQPVPLQPPPQRGDDW